MDSAEESRSPHHAALTDMEREVTRLVTLGCTSLEIAALLGRSRHSVINYKNGAMFKLRVHNSASLTRQALTLGITTLADALTTDEQARLRANRAMHVSRHSR